MTISSQIIEVLNDLCMKFGMAIDWSQENVTPYLQELAGKYISWEVATSWAWIVIGVIVILIGIALWIFECKTNVDDFLYLIALVLFAFGAFIVVCQVFDILECKYFPEKAIFEYIKSFMSNT